MFPAPDLSLSQINECANDLINDYFKSIGESVSLPIPVEDIAEFYLGYELAYTNEGMFSDSDILGGICFKTQTIFINTSVESHEGRHAFTIAHEIGHHCLHKQIALAVANKVMCRKEVKPLEELQADRFAAALLMPETLMLAHIKKCKLSDPYKAFKLAKNVKGELRLNNVSVSALVNRMIDLKLITGLPYQRSRPFVKMPLIKKIAYIAILKLKAILKI